MSWRLAALVFGAAGIAGCGHSVAEHPADGADDEAAVVVRVAPAETRVLDESVKVIGQCEALVGKLAMLTPAIEGHVHAILVAQGASVQAGQPIIELDTSLPAADVAEKVAGRDAAAAALELLESLPRPEEQRINQLAIEQARVALERAQSLLDNLKPLEARNEVSQQQMFDAQKAVEQARLQKESAEAQFRVSMLAPRAEAIAEAKARIGIAQRAANTSQARLDLHVIRAPVDGVLQDLTCHPGQTIAVGAPVGEIVDTRQVYVRAWLPPRSAREVRVGQKAKVFIDMHFEAAVGAIGSEGASDTESFLSAEVVFVGRVADVQTGNLPVRCLVENSDGQLAIGQTVGLAITVHAGAEVLSVPAAAIFDLGEGPVLCVVRDGKAMQLHPQLGISEDGWVAVSDTDLDAGEQVIVEGGYNLEDETPVKVEGDAPAKEADGQ